MNPPRDGATNNRAVIASWKRYRAALEAGLPLLRREMPDLARQDVAAIARIDQIIARREQQEPR